MTMAEPGLALQCQQVLAVPAKRYDRQTVAFLDEQEAAALLAAPDRRTWIGRRDRVAEARGGGGPGSGQVDALVLSGGNGFGLMGTQIWAVWLESCALKWA